MSVSDLQNISMSSTAGIKGFVNSRILFYSEGSLLLSLLLVFLVVNPLATLAITIFMGGVLYILNGLISSKLRRIGLEQIGGSQVTLETARDLHGIRREAHTAGVVDQWLARFSEGRSTVAKAQALIYTLNSLPRFVIETSLILGIFIFIGGVVVFSDIPSQSVTIGVFLAGGLRIMASVIPFQGAITGMRAGEATGQLAFAALTGLHEKTENSIQNKSLNVPPTGRLVFRNVHFSYVKGSGSTLTDVSFEIEPNTRVAIVGPSGAGKSTIFELAMGFVVPDNGEVSIGKESSKSVLLNFPGYFSVVPQRPHLITGSVLENVSMLPANKTDSKRVKEVLRKVGLKNLTSLENWQGQQFRPDSGNFSGGEMQRLSLARALYRNPKMLFLDEATSALDAKTELEITELLDALKSEVTVVTIAHRLSTVKSADNILYVDSGKVVAQGTFRELRTQVPDFNYAVKLMNLDDSV